MTLSLLCWSMAQENLHLREVVRCQSIKKAFISETGSYNHISSHRIRSNLHVSFGFNRFRYLIKLKYITTLISCNHEEYCQGIHVLIIKIPAGANFPHFCAPCLVCRQNSFRPHQLLKIRFRFCRQRFPTSWIVFYQVLLQFSLMTPTAATMCTLRWCARRWVYSIAL